jgi:hypothetical protein
MCEHQRESSETVNRVSFGNREDSVRKALCRSGHISAVGLRALDPGAKKSPFEPVKAKPQVSQPAQFMFPTSCPLWMPSLDLDIITIITGEVDCFRLRLVTHLGYHCPPVNT